MKLATFVVDTALGPFERIGAWLDDDGLLDLNAAYGSLLQTRGEPRPEALAAAVLPANMLEFLAAGPRAMEAAREALSALGRPAAADRRGPRGERIAYGADEIRLLAPLPRPGALRDFMAFEEHARRSAARRGEPMAKEWFETPVSFKGNPREIYGPGAEIPWPSYTRRLDFECELACVVGRRGRNLSPESAKGFIAGYTLFNDFSARDAQKREMATRMGPAKGKDFANALGPYVLTADEAPHLDALVLTVRVNGERWAEGRFDDRYWDFETMIAHASQEETVLPGDVIGSGCFYRGCGLDLDRWLQPGDTVEIEAPGLGVLRNTVGRPDKDGRPGPLTYPGRRARRSQEPDGESRPSPRS